MTHEETLSKLLKDLERWVYQGPFSVLTIAEAGGINYSTLSMAKGKKPWNLQTKILMSLARARDKLEANSTAVPSVERRRRAMIKNLKRKAPKIDEA